MKVWQEVCLSETSGIVAELLGSALSIVGVEVYLSKFNQTKSHFSLLIKKPLRVFLCLQMVSMGFSHRYGWFHLIGSLG